MSRERLAAARNGADAPGHLGQLVAEHASVGAGIGEHRQGGVGPRGRYEQQRVTEFGHALADQIPPDWTATPRATENRSDALAASRSASKWASPWLASASSASSTTPRAPGTAPVRSPSSQPGPPSGPIGTSVAWDNTLLCT